MSTFDFRRQALNILIIPVLIFLFVLVIHSVSPVSNRGDSRHTLLVSLSLLKELNTNLDEYMPIIREDYGFPDMVSNVKNHWYSWYPIGTSIMVAPYVYLFDKFSLYLPPRGVDKGLLIDVDGADKIQIFMASVIVALTSVNIYYICRLFLSTKFSFITTIIFSFGTSTWSIASRSLLQHGPTMLLLSLALLLLLNSKNNQFFIPLIGFILAFAFIVRPTNAISLVVFSLYVLIKHRRFVLFYALFVLIVLAPFFIYSLHVYHQLLPPYYSLSNQKLWFPGLKIEYILVQLVSPNRGFFVFHPIFLFSIYGLYLKVKTMRFKLLDGLIIVIILLHAVVIYTNHIWWRGWGYGPRYYTDMLPLFVYFLIPVVKKIQDDNWSVSKIILVFLFSSLALISIFIHFNGATNYVTKEWNEEPPIDSHPSRAWDWHDLQFLR